MKRILIVDESPVIRSVIKIFLEQMRYGFVEAADATRALELLERERVDLAIVDLAALALIRRLRDDPRPDVRDLPVVLLTADRSREAHARGEAAGASAVLCKPVSSAGLLSLVRSLAPAALARA